MKIGAMLGNIVTSLFKEPVTEKYPFERKPSPENLRGKLSWDPTKCTGCMLCIKDCPANAIELITIDKANKRFVMKYHMDRCTFCDQCVVNCRSKCLNLSSEDWELASLTQEPLTIYYGRDEDIQFLLEKAAMLSQKLPASKEQSFRLALVGVGNELQADDAAGLLVIRAVKARVTRSPNLLLIEGGMAPENFTGKIRRFAPDVVIFFDAADMDAPVGTVRWLGVDEIDGFSASSHSLPLSVVSHFISQDIGCETGLIAIQIAALELNGPVSGAVFQAASDIAADLIELINPDGLIND